MTLVGVLTFAGGVGLFLLGMRLMSDGLKVAAGPALRELLARATGSPLRAVGSGVLITAMVQSSSAVVFATIGFVNAGLLTLAQAIGVIYGANIGTTLTSWIVAVVGFNVDLQTLAMPAIAFGMAGWVGGRGRGVALGQALVGFGIFFLGLDVLKSAFTEAEDVLGLVESSGGGVLRLLPYVGVGVVMTVLMQSSSAALAVTLTAAAGGLLPLPAATAMVIGANVGTTSTAVFATIGATAPARRAAMAHVLFNVVAALAALAAFPLLLGAAVALPAWVGADQQPATVLAVFHTLSKLLGVLLIWPFTTRLVAFLERRFQVRQADPAVLQFLDRTVAATPRLAIDALALELRRIGTLAHRMARAALSSEAPDTATAAGERSVIDNLGESAISFTGLVTSGGDRWVDSALPDAVRVVQYYRTVAERAADLAQLPPLAAPPPELDAALLTLQRAADQALTAADPAALEDLDEAVILRAAEEFEQIYPHTKAELLRAGSRGILSAAALVRALDRISMMRRMVDQACKAARYLAHLRPPYGHTGHAGHAPPAVPASPPASAPTTGAPADQLPIHDHR